jgi:two-component system OmpR family response regulator
MEKSISQSENSAGPPLPQKPNPRQRILVVEGEADIRRLHSEVLARSGYHVDTVEDGAVAWETLQQNSYDLLVTAHYLPKMSGIELIKKMHDTSIRLPVIMTTRTLPRWDTWELAARPWLEPTAVMRAPYTTEELLGMVKNLLHATNHAREEISPPPNRTGQPPATDLRSLPPGAVL